MLPEKLPILTKRGDHLTEKQWEYYFECRKKYDHYVSDEEGLKIVQELNKLDACYPRDKPEIRRLTSQLPVIPELARAIKEVQGMMMICEYNLFEAKKAYPDEF